MDFEGRKWTHEEMNLPREVTVKQCEQTNQIEPVKIDNSALWTWKISMFTFSAQT